jgi:hypothetical protein
MSFVSWLVNLFLQFLWGKATDAIVVAEKDKAAHDAQVAQAAQDVQKAKDLKPDSTAGDIDAAIDDELSHM